MAAGDFPAVVVRVDFRSAVDLAEVVRGAFHLAVVRLAVRRGWVVDPRVTAIGAVVLVP